MKDQPPRWPDRFLSWFCDREQVEIIRGDLYELFHFRLKTQGKTHARWGFLWDVLRYFRISNFKTRWQPRVNPFYMFSNYIKIGFRNLSKNWWTSLINISGLSLSVGCAITTFLFADFFFNLNTIHSNRDNIYQIISHIEEENESKLYGPSSMILGEIIEESHPAVDASVRVAIQKGHVKFGRNVFTENIYYTDPSFLTTFDFPISQGGANPLAKGEVYLTGEIAKKYFGDLDPLNRRVDIKFSEENIQSFTVAGVFGEIAKNSTFKPEVLIHLAHRQRTSENQWSDYVKATFVSLKQGKSPPEMALWLQKQQEEQNLANPENPVIRYELVRLDELSKLAGSIQERIVYGNDYAGTMGIAIVGFLLLLFACLNYVNIAIASAARRLKEIGIRKVMGSSKTGIAQQFLVENFLLCLLAMVIGTVACYIFFLPGFNYLSPVEIPFSFSSNQVAVLYFLGLFFFLGLLSGSYPAFYISKFEPLKIFRGVKKIGTNNNFSRILLTIQFFLAFVTILSCFIFTDHAYYVKGLSWGYEPSGILAIPVLDDSQIQALKNEADSYAAVEKLVAAQGHIGLENKLVPFEFLDHRFKVIHYSIEPGYLQVMNTHLEAGRFFDQVDEDKNTIIINRHFARTMSWDQPLGQSLNWKGETKTVVGVISNVRHAFFDHDIKRPMIFTPSVEGPYNFLIAKGDPERMAEIDVKMEESWRAVFPNDPYNRFYQGEIFDRAYRNVDANTMFMLSISVMTIILSCLGLYGLLAFTLQNRLKEFSIRKVLGASWMHITQLANKEFALILIISFGLGIPVSIGLMKSATDHIFSVAKPFSLLPILVCTVITLVTIAITVFGQIRKASLANPAQILRSE